MKKLIFNTPINAVTERTLRSHIISGFKKAGCSTVNILQKTDIYYRVELTLPNGIPTSICVWFDRPQNLATGHKTVQDRKFKVDPTWTFNSSGNVFDVNGNLIGRVYAVELFTTHTVPRIRKDYDKDSIVTDSGDVVIDHPERANTYVDVVNSLMTRNITYRS